MRPTPRWPTTRAANAPAATTRSTSSVTTTVANATTKRPCLRAGETPTVFECRDAGGQAWRVGQSVCYDLRFGELYRMLAADVLLVPSAFTHTTGQAHWEVLLRARAIENQAFVIASAQGGVHENGRRTWGHTMVIDPWGGVMAMQAEGPGVVMAELDFEQLRSVREQLPSLQHRRL